MSNIKSLVRKKIDKQRLWNLSVKDDESFIANGIVVHNCKTYMEVNLRAAKNNPEAQKIAPNEQQIKSKSLMEVV